ALALSIDRAAKVAGDGATLLVRARLHYRSRRHAEPEVALTADAGTLGPPVREGDDLVAPWTLPDRFGGRRAAAVIARAGPLSAHAEVALAPAPPSRLELATPLARIV